MQAAEDAGAAREGSALREWLRHELVTVALALPPHDVPACSEEGGVGRKYLAPRRPNAERAETHGAPRRQENGDVEVAQTIPPRAHSEADCGAHR